MATKKAILFQFVLFSVEKRPMTTGVDMRLSLITSPRKRGKKKERYSEEAKGNPPTYSRWTSALLPNKINPRWYQNGEGGR
ncbi:hypothetical protein JTE90_009338 [Oedothorax gibbosus]|uniref:Uncharacterized protein n=1 Tax=Oedothorax gibbosus TaxID=931172 RepID=A0AAV6VTP1_9ARAC|nr:hypothetical protein JTE90_009338 [Oedothorax gibbosus]